jgi:two-component system response regulator HydG
MSGKLLVVDDEAAMGDLVSLQLGKRGYEVTAVLSAESALEVLEESEPDLVLTDIHMPGMDGIQLTKRIAANRPELPVVVVTSFGTLESAVAALRVGAYDFVTKPFETEVLIRAVERALTHCRLREEVEVLRRAVEAPGHFDEILGESRAMRRIFALVEKAARSDAGVLLRGESGTGKELIAKALHRRSRRTAGPFVAINCSAMPETLLESELFGHEKGAFTDAKSARHGLFVQADGGTLFLDEIGDMPLGLQPKLLRSLEERTVRPVGGAREIVFDARIIAATNRDLGLAVEEGRFREDLFYRLNVIQIDIPPLRERGRDVLLLAQAFLERFVAASEAEVTGLTPQAAERLLAYSWPGNVRELRNCMERAVAMTTADQITLADLPDQICNYRSTHVIVAADQPEELVSLDEVERRYILRVLQAVHGNKAQAARILGLDRKTLYRKLERYGAAGERDTEAGE